MSRTKNPTLRRRTRELSDCAEDARECQLLGYELKDLGSLLVKMAIHMEDLQRKVDSQAEYIKTLNADRKTEPQRGYMWKCPKCGTENHSDFESCPCCGWNRIEDEPQTEVKGSERWLKSSEQSDAPILTASGWKRIKETMPECRLILFDDDGNYIEPQTDCAWAAPDAPRTVPLYPMKEGGED